MIPENLILGLGSRLNIRILKSLTDNLDKELTIEGMAKDLKIDYSTAFRHLEKLCDAGYFTFDYENKELKAIKTYYLKDEIKDNKKLIDFIQSIQLHE